MNIKVLPRQQTAPVFSRNVQTPPQEVKEEKLRAMPQEQFEDVINEFISGKSKFDQCTAKLKGFCVDAEAISSVFSMHLIDNQDEGYWICKVLNHMMSADKNFTTKEAVITGLKAAWEEAPTVRQFDNPRVYVFLEEYFLELRNGGFLSKEDIEEFFETKIEDKVKFARIFDTEGNYIVKRKSENISKDDNNNEQEEAASLDVTLMSPESSTPASSPSNATEISTTPETPATPEAPATPELSKFEAKVASRLNESDYKQPPPGVTVGKFKNISHKFDYALEKNLKKKNLEPMIKLIENENCKYDGDFMGEFTQVILKKCCQKAKSAEFEMIEKMVINSLDLIKRYVNNNLTLELQCISGIQAYVYGTKNEYPGEFY